MKSLSTLRKTDVEAQNFDENDDGETFHSRIYLI